MRRIESGLLRHNKHADLAQIRGAFCGQALDIAIGGRRQLDGLLVLAEFNPLEVTGLAVAGSLERVEPVGGDQD